MKHSEWRLQPRHVNPRIQDEKNVKEIVGICDAYYGSESRLALEFMLEKKPVMIMAVELM